LSSSASWMIAQPGDRGGGGAAAADDDAGGADGGADGAGGAGGAFGGVEGGLGLQMHAILTSSKAMSPVKLVPRLPSNVKPAVGTDADALPQVWPWSPDFVHTVLPKVLFSRLSEPMVAPFMWYHQLTSAQSPCRQA
jgi:hypothetical protein